MSSAPFVPPTFGPREAQPLDSMIPDARSIAKGLFEEVDPKDLPAGARLAIEKQKATQEAAARLFTNNADFRLVLEALCDVTVRRPQLVIMPGVTTEFAALYSAKREGQNELLYLLLAWIAEGRGEQSPRREPT